MVTLTNPDKVLYPATGTTKADVFGYYTTIAAVMLPHIEGRPATRKRWPNGVDQPAFFEKALAKSAPDWLHRGVVTHRSGDTVYPIIDSPPGLAWIAQQAALEVHVPQWRFAADGKPGPANRLVFDLDPGEGVTMTQMCEVAVAVRELMSDIGLMLYPLTSGSKGLHLYAALPDPVGSDGAVKLARRVADQLEQSMPTLVTATMTKSLRTGKIFLDWSQNNAAKTTIAPYSLRGRDMPTVAAPRTWEELDDAGLRQLRYDEVLARVAEHGDLLAGLDDLPQAGPVTTHRGQRLERRTKEQPGAHPQDFAPMLATLGSVDTLTSATHAFEGKYDGYRMLVEADHGRLRLLSRNGRDVTGEYPSLQSLAVDLNEHHVILDGEVVALDADGVPCASHPHDSGTVEPPVPSVSPPPAAASESASALASKRPPPRLQRLRISPATRTLSRTDSDVNSSRRWNVRARPHQTAHPPRSLVFSTLLDSPYVFLQLSL